MRSLKLARLAVLASFLILGAAGAAAAADTIKIAVPSPFTGAAAGYGDNVKAGVELKLAEINAAGGINGKQVVAEFLDEQCDPKEAATVAAKIVQDDAIVGVVGHLCSSAHLAALPNYVKKGIVAVSPTATNVTISEKNKDKAGKAWSYRVVYRDDFQGAFLARYASQVLGLKAIAVFYENNDYGIGLKEAFVKEAKKIGLAVVGEEGYMKGASDFTPQLTSLKSKNPDGLFISGYYNEGALIATQAKKLGMNVAKFGADGLDNADYIKLAADAAENTYMTVPFLAEAASADAQAFLKKFADTYKRESDWMSANAFDATGVVLEAVKAAGMDRAKVRDAIAAMNSPETGFKGITGNTYFDANGDCLKNAFVKVVKGGTFVPADKQME
ncbi:ABC transporter substrate-binding protein [Megalodesulfovibrio gigas]|uniref:Putative Extracellular ligand-binding receptor n=1 Tax=Megalodesulfovibrio gigas (strain ATCC 19364 / DSM 1382 / NCIMB 9332 / VKM B-1759) TaxID=1121448 RepID=T2GDH1_MEGG1|nr:ABC transporter substrate-binding protein [Megalodesulfovibrio gigas]AGW13962.1 putative Extracellular ligand-binding receptor [Megalodesulfovibrio gigas DSM 1382 = ATCC 19364]